jgi:hypothetical protein
MSKPTEVVKTTAAGATIQNVYICKDFNFELKNANSVISTL